MGLHAIILAAGKGTRMKSDILKVAHRVAGKPIVEYVLDTVSSLGVDGVYMVVGHQAELIQSSLAHPKMTYVTQAEQLGTGHAVMQVAPYFQSNTTDSVIVLAGDCPLISEATLRNLLAVHTESNAAATVLTTMMDPPGTYGRIHRGKMGRLAGIKEAKDCTPKELEIREINTGVYIFNAKYLFAILPELSTNNAQNEYYLTDVIHMLKARGKSIEAYCTPDSDQAIGINTRMDMAKINAILYQNNNQILMQEGVTIVDPASTFVDSTVKIGRDSILNPFTVIRGETQIGHNCQIGPHAVLTDCQVDDNSVVPPFSVIG
jgi:bifunctional UDP-N-acetylglucosamine pyrophosphorylase / glucosamine-1-phosphate N-acetyltransferase